MTRVWASAGQGGRAQEEMVMAVGHAKVAGRQRTRDRDDPTLWHIPSR
jgi:hypothetical protein